MTPVRSDRLPLGLSPVPPCQPWGINFGGGLNSTAIIIECRKRGFRPDWILFADTGSERPETLSHVERMKQWCAGWQDVTVVRWIRQDGTHTPLHEDCLRKKTFPSKAYGFAGCTDKWKVQPMDKWRKAHGFDRGAFAVGYDMDESTRIHRACQRGDMPDMTAWYPLLAWGVDRAGCQAICAEAGITCAKSSCFMCPNMQRDEWEDLRATHLDLFDLAMQIERTARGDGEHPQAGMERHTPGYLFDEQIRADVDAHLEKMRLEAIARRDRENGQTSLFSLVDDRCHHAGCFT
jgi:hypothetical protein